MQIYIHHCYTISIIEKQKKKKYNKHKKGKRKTKYKEVGPRGCGITTH